MHSFWKNLVPRSWTGSARRTSTSAPPGGTPQRRLNSKLSNRRHTPRLAAVAALVTSVLFTAAPLATAAEPQTPPAVARSLQDAIRTYLTLHTQGLGPQVSIEIPALDPRTRVGECDFHEVFLPPGGRLWGRSHVAVRCGSPSAWLIYVPVIVRIHGNYLLSARDLSAGQTLTNPDFRVEQGDLSQFPEGVLRGPDQAIGQRMRTGLSAGQALRQDHLVRTPLIRQGEMVKIVFRGKGFSVSSEGRALTNGYENEIVKVKNAAGKTMQGRALSAGVIEVSQ